MTAQAGSIDSNPAEAPPAEAGPAGSPPATVTAPRRRRRAARWRPSAAVLAIVIALVASQAVALAIVSAAIYASSH